MLYFPKWKVAAIVLVCVFGIVFAAPNLVSSDRAAGIPDWLPHKQINLGLDLRGGSHLLIEVQLDVVVQERLESMVDSIRQTLRNEKIGYTGLGKATDSVSLKIRKPEQLERAMSAVRGLIQPLSSGLLSGISQNDFDLTEEQGRLTLTMTEPAVQEIHTKTIEQSIEIVRRRIDEFGVAEPTIQRQGADRILVQLPGVDDPGRIKDTLKTTAKMVFRMVNVNLSPGDRIPPGSEVLPSVDASGQGPREFVVFTKVLVSGESLVDAQPGFDQQNNRPVVTFRFDSSGAKKFADATIANVKKPFAIVLDDKVISAPVIQEPILGGTGQISGSFTVQETHDLALLLRAGALPAPLKYLEERSVGPDLGADSIAAGQMASVLGLVLVIVFMILAYGGFGLAANAALLTNLVLIVAALSLLQATLTLPGIAGIVLTIGMAVDANVLILERIREETRTGKSPFNAVEAGYRRAFTTIIDANVTTLIAASILFAFGSGPVRGFAITLGIGIATSMFSAVLLTRLMIASWLKRKRPSAINV